MSELTDFTQTYATRLGDDSLVLGQRLSEWCSRAPFLEEDLALANTALDYIGRARMFYSYAAQLADDGRSEDELAYLRDEREFQNLLMHELPRGDFAFTMVRQFLLDTYYVSLLTGLSNSKNQQLSGIAQKAVKESRYHQRRSEDWLLKLGNGTEESQQRCQHALDDLWGYTTELFEPDDIEQGLIDAGIAVDTPSLKTDWLRTVSEVIANARISLPDSDWAVRGGRQGYHTENLGRLLSEMQSLHRAMPGLEW